MIQLQVARVEFLAAILAASLLIQKVEAFARRSNNVTTRDSFEDITRDGDRRAPFWNIAHMINSVKEIEPALREGANGIEVDVSFDKRGVPEATYHGIPCDCGRVCSEHEDFVRFIQSVARISMGPYSDRLQLVMFDLKLKDLNNNQKVIAGRSLANVLHEHLYKGLYEETKQQQRRPPSNFDDNNNSNLYKPPVRVVVSINHVNDNTLVDSFLSYMHQNQLDFMHQHVGFDVGMNDNLNNITTMWSSFNGATTNIWQGDGLTNCVNIARGVERLQEAIQIRNAQGHFKKIYYWTTDVLWHIRAVLRFGLDAVLTNQPRRVNWVLNEPEFIGKYRLATPFDDPFAQYYIKPTASSMPTPTMLEAVETIDNIQQTSAKYFQKLPDGIATALKKFCQKIVSSNS